MGATSTREAMPPDLTEGGPDHILGWRRDSIPLSISSSSPLPPGTPPKTPSFSSPTPTSDLFPRSVAIFKVSHTWPQHSTESSETDFFHSVQSSEMALSCCVCFWRPGLSLGGGPWYVGLLNS